MTVDEAMTEASLQISQSQYLRECNERIYKTGLNTVYGNKADMLQTLLWHINVLQQEKAERDKMRCETCEYWRCVDVGMRSCDIADKDDFCSYFKQRRNGNE